MSREVSRRRVLGITTSLLVAGCSLDEPKNCTHAKEKGTKPVNGVTEAWERIHTWLSKHAPKILASLNPPATDAQIAAAEKAFKVRMPDEWRELYRVHDGMNDDSNLGSLFYGMNFLTLERAIVEYGLNDENDEPEAKRMPATRAEAGIRTEDMHNRKWIAVAHDGGATLIRVDMDPAPAGHPGQVIFTDHDDDVVFLIAQNIGKLLWQFVEDLEAGRYVLDEDAREDGDEFLSPVPEIDVVNWHRSSRWKHLDK
jgi:cell wall assembly regulator SMI1